MLTVKLVEPKNEYTGKTYECVVESSSVWAECDNPDKRPLEYTVFASVHNPDGSVSADSPARFSKHGTVYVMNEAGNTVSRYYLGDARASSTVS